ncbi:MAG TPA: enoyl-CoA hydratase-related protein [Acidimicrobiales bacterium]|nr:enoyl-CoA hydratase-related protein [Acidimicrobiales bacterium]
MDYQTILTEDKDGVATVTFNRPDRMNAYTARLGLEVRHAIVTFDRREDVRAIVVTGAGRAFCAGADLAAGADTFSGGGGGGSRGGVMTDRSADELRIDDRREYWEMNTPIIAAINGHAIGVGLTMPMQWDIRVAAEEAKLAFAFSRRGVIPELSANWIVPRIVGVSRGLELLMTGRTFSGREAAEMGLVSEALPADQVLARALDLARDIAENVAPVSAGIVKRLVYSNLAEPDRPAAQRREGALFGWTTGQPDSREGPMAFLEKRSPQWRLSKNADFPEEVFAEGAPGAQPSRAE